MNSPRFVPFIRSCNPELNVLDGHPKEYVPTNSKADHEAPEQTLKDVTREGELSLSICPEANLRDSTFVHSSFKRVGHLNLS